jgi:hypothetical protein
MKDILRSVGQFAVSLALAIAFLVAVVEVQAKFGGDGWSLSLLTGDGSSDPAAAVAAIGRFAIVASTAALLVTVGALICFGLRRKPDPQVDFTTADGNHVRIRLSMPAKEISANVQRIRTQLEIFEKAATAPELQDH